MIKLNWIIILAILVLSVFLYINNSEHFGAIDTINPEAVRNISSVYNTDNLTATNITSSGKLQSDGITVFKNGTHFPYTDGKNYIRGPTQVDGQMELNNKTIFNNEITVSNINIPGAYISKSDVSPNALNVTYGDGSGWRMNFKKWDGNTFASLYDNGTFCLGNTCINEAELKNLKVAARRMYSQQDTNNDSYDVFNFQGMVVPNLNCHGNQNKLVENLGCWFHQGPDGRHINLK